MFDKYNAKEDALDIHSAHLVMEPVHMGKEQPQWMAHPFYFNEP